MGIYPADRYPEAKTHNHAKYIYAPYLVVPPPAGNVKWGGCNACDFTFNVQAAELALFRRSGDGRPGVDNLSVFCLAQGEQSGDDVMARLVTFIRAAKQTLAFAIYDMRLS